jgi:hypothetical protein
MSATAAATPQEVWDTQVVSTPETAVDWIWPGFISRGSVTMLTSMWKAGKTTLLAHLLARRAVAQPFLGLPVAPGKTVVISEEPRPLWADRCRQFNFGGNLCLFTQPFGHLPSAAEWRGLIERVGQLHTEQGVDLLVVDSLTHFLRAENAAAGILELLMPVRALTAQGMGALLLHHPSKKAPGLGLAGRGHGALHAEVDISIEMRHAGGNLDSRARRFFTLSRLADTPRHFLFELNADGADYTPLSVPDDDGFDAQRPDDHAKPSLVTLWNWLKRAVADKLIQVEGTGRKADPFRYWLAATEERWRKEHFFYDHFERQRQELKLPFRSLRDRKRDEADNRRFDCDQDSDSESEGGRIWPPGAPLE